MRIYVISDLHVEYKQNRNWVNNLSRIDYKQDTLIIAGDVAADLNLIEEVFKFLSGIFFKVVYVPGNHDLWVNEEMNINSIEKLEIIRKIADKYDISMSVVELSGAIIVPLYSWYDYSFGKLNQELINTWADFRRCKWPQNFSQQMIAECFFSINKTEDFNIKNKKIISFSHFLPDIKLVPRFFTNSISYLFPVMGSKRLLEVISNLQSDIHVFGHLHVNCNKTQGKTRFINNSFGYTYETYFNKKKLQCIYEG
ncbi:metallophosphoesterase family protein [Cellulosilyticum ruminicola]|uniref:metallophosphoesterase family protein n=1 Tax=Cellulosilyticum ruminicola TaxID=425254 RepID=UPI0006D0746E|nr:metallophosphoesterase [Cellulosilyticum ruminicola]